MMKRQGDLLIVKVKKIPENAIGQNSRVLAEGEATGHKHELTDGEVYAVGDVLYFRVPEGKSVTLNHPEHKPITFESGDYQIVAQREYEPSGWRRVAD